MALSCARGALDCMLGKVSSPKGFLSIVTGCPGKWQNPHPWRYLKDHVYVTLGGLHSAALMIRVNDLNPLFQPK